MSERLVFSLQESTFGLTDIQPDKDLYQPREQVTMAIRVSDENNEPLSGNFSIAVVDKKDVEIDTTSTLISTLLLSSELKGHIENPMSYLKRADKRSALALDILMMTQGWRRYPILDLIKGELTRDLLYTIELGDEVTGRVEGVFSALKEGTISLLAYNDSVLGTSLAQPDSKGVFTFKDLEYPEGTKYFIQALTKKNSKKVFLEVEPLKTFPPITVSSAPVFHEKPLIEDTYISKMNQKYTIENGMRVYNLVEVIITGKNINRLPTQSPYYSVSSSKVLTEKDVEQWRPLSVLDLLRRIPGITVSGNEVRYRTGNPMVIVDNVPEDDFNYEDLDVNDIKDVFVSPPESSAPIFGGRAAFGAVIINTKKDLSRKTE
ncbi:MAG: Plug domain-containing protein [Bacteroides sp.]|nr:Plug domain-containing protein [Bacteroides sp.]